MLCVRTFSITKLNFFATSGFPVILSLAFMLLATVTEGQLKIKNYELCGGTGIVNWIVVSPCEKEPCGFKRNSKIYVDLEAAFDQPSETVTLASIARVGDTNMTLVGVPTDFCKANIIECPVHGKGDFRRAKFIVPIRKFYKPNPYNATFLGYGDSGLELCVRLLINVLE